MMDISLKIKILVFSLILFSCQSENEENPKIYTITTYKVVPDLSNHEILYRPINEKQIIETFDQKQNKISFLRIDKNGNEEYRTTWKYNEQNELVEIKHFSQDSLIHYTLIESSDTLKKTKFYFAKYKNPSSSTAKYYDSLGRLKNELNFGESKILLNEFIHTFNSAENIQYIEHYYKNDLVMVTERWFDGNNNIIKHLNISQKESKIDTVFYHEYVYNESNQKVKIVSNVDSVEIKYDRFGNQIEYVQTSNTGYVEKYEYHYKYDKYNNWIFKETIYNNENKTFEKRKIEYRN